MIDIEYLKQLKFKKVWLSDKSGYWYEKKVKHPLLKNVEIIVEDDKIYLDCRVCFELCNMSIYECKATIDNLERILIWLDVDFPIRKEK